MLLLQWSHLFHSSVGELLCGRKEGKGKKSLYTAYGGCRGADSNRSNSSAGSNAAEREAAAHLSQTVADENSQDAGGVQSAGVT